ncbi:zinc finger protein 646 [Rhinophrynus dorsalis]
MNEEFFESDQLDGASDNHLSCDQCSSTFTSLSELTSHLETHKEERPYKCNQCDRSYRHAGSLVNHKKTHQIGLYSCLICQKEYSNPMGLKNHLRTHSEEKRFQCDECGESFRMSRQLSSHRKTSHSYYSVSNGEDIPNSHASMDAPVPVLAENGNLINNLENYIAESMVPGDFSQLASKYYPDVKLPGEASVKHEDEKLETSTEEKEDQLADGSCEERRYKCNQCDKAYKHAGSLANHRQSHSLGVFQCAVCYKEFLNLMAMKNHCRIHSDTRRQRRCKLSYSAMKLGNHSKEDKTITPQTAVSNSMDIVEKLPNQQTLSDDNFSEEEHIQSTPQEHLQNSLSLSTKDLKKETSKAMNLDPRLQISCKDNLVLDEESPKQNKHSFKMEDETGLSQIEQQGLDITDEEEAKPGENLENRPFMCQLCGKTYRHAGSLINHKKTHQTGVYSCSICSKQMFNMAALKNHLRAHFKSRAGRKLEDSYFHSSSFSDEGTYQCGICNEILTCESDFLQHQDFHQFEGMKENNSDAQDAEVDTTADNCWGANITGSQGSSVDSAYSSGPGIPDAIKQKGENITCQEQLSKEESTAMSPDGSHKENLDHSFQNAFTCFEQTPENKMVCKETDCSELEEQDPPSEDRPYKCEACGKTYRHKSSLLNHKLTHQTGVYPCSICPKQYSNLMALRNHLRFHSRMSTGRPGSSTKSGHQSFSKPKDSPNMGSPRSGESVKNNIKEEVSTMTIVDEDIGYPDKTEEVSPIQCACGKLCNCDASFQTHRQFCKKALTSSDTEENSGDLKSEMCKFIDSEGSDCNVKGPGLPQGKSSEPEEQTGRRLYECDLCEKSYRHSGSLINHKRTHQTGDYSCTLCSKHVHNLAALKNHLRIHHKVKRGSPGEKNDSSKFLYSEMCFSPENNGEFACASCEEFFSSEEELVAHQEVHMELEGHTWCPQEENLIPTGLNDTDLEVQKRVSSFRDLEHYNEFEHCTRSDDFQKSQNEHVESKDIDCTGDEKDELEHTCVECGEVFGRIEDLNDHKYTHQTGIYQCSFCPKEYPNLVALKNHFLSHTKPQAFKNDSRDISEGSGDQDLACNQLSVHHNYDCGHCGMVFSNEVDFHQHQVAHENQIMNGTTPGLHNEEQASEFPFPMHSSEKELLKRIKTEIEEGVTSEASYEGPHVSHICGFCGKNYDDLESLQAHGLSHSEEEMPSAEESHTTPNVELENKIVESSPDLKENSDEPSRSEESQENRPYTCDQCGKTYRHGGSLVNHKKTHQVGNFQCFACSRQYPNLAAFRNHLRHHPKCKRAASLGSMQELQTQNTQDSAQHLENGELLNYPSADGVPITDLYVSPDLYNESKASINPAYKNASLEGHSSPHLHLQSPTNHIKTFRRSVGAKSAKKSVKRHKSLANRSLDVAGQSVLSSDSANDPQASDRSAEICEFCGSLFFSVHDLIIHVSSSCVGSKLTDKAGHTPASDHMAGKEEPPLSLCSQTREVEESGYHQRPFRCEVCGRSYRHAGSLINHKQTHKTGVFRCAICQKRFFNLMAMKNHNRIHFEVKRHKCLDCGKAFRLRKQLDTHQRIHREKAACKRPGRRKCRVSKSHKVLQQKTLVVNDPVSSQFEDSPIKQEDSIDEHYAPSSAPAVGVGKRELNPDSRPYQCEQCGRSYRHAGSLVNHKKSHKMGQFCCSICNKTYPNLMAMKNHQRTHYEAKRHHCLECGSSFKWKRQLTRHQLIHARDTAQTDGSQPMLGLVQADEEIAGKKVTSVSRKGSRKRSIVGKEARTLSHSLSPSLQPICQDCGILFVSYEELESHVCRESSTGSAHWQSSLEQDESKSGVPAQKCQVEERPYQCNVCGRTYRHAGSLLNHKNTHKTGLYKCSVCLKQFSNPMAMKNHLRTHTAQKRFQCLECGKAFRSSRELICHHRVHTGERPFRCPICSRGFSSKLTLRHHQRTHKELPPRASPSLSSSLHLPIDQGRRNSDDDPTVSKEENSSQDDPHAQDERRFKCNQCDRSYRHAGSLLNHRKTHSTGVYQCSDCNKEFFNLLALKNHLRIHRYPCQDCGKAFRIASHLATHRKIHEQGGPLTCSLCSKRFSCRSSFERHQLTHNKLGTDVLEPQTVGNFMVEVT